MINKMHVDTLYPSKYLKAADLPEEGTQSFKIETVKIEEIGKNKDEKPVIHFDNGRSMVCNKTNANTIAKALNSKDTDDWIGKSINLYRAEVEFGGEMVESIRVKLKSAKLAGPLDDALSALRPASSLDDDIPF